AELAMGLGVERLARAGGAGRGHERFLSLAELAGDVEQMDESIDAGLKPPLVDANSPALVAGVVRAEHLANLLDRDLEVAEPPDRPRDLELLRPIAAVAGEPVHVGGPQQVELVVVPQRADRQPGQPGEPPDRDQAVGGALDRAVACAGVSTLHAAHPEPSGWSRVKPSIAQAPSSSREMARRMNRAASADLPPSFWPSSCSSATIRSPSIASRAGVRSSDPSAIAA